jgi:hypothetical protein
MSGVHTDVCIVATGNERVDAMHSFDLNLHAHQRRSFFRSLSVLNQLEVPSSFEKPQ